MVGDFFLDRYYVIDPALAEPSLETGLTAHQVVAVRDSPGAAGTVVNNLVALGTGSILAFGMVGDDAHGHALRRLMEFQRVDCSNLLAVPDRMTPTYTKPMRLTDQGEVESERIDIVNRSPTPERHVSALLDRLENHAHAVDAIILLDQVTTADHGVITRRFRDSAAELARRTPGTLFYADSRAFLSEFRQVVVKANHHEASRALENDKAKPFETAPASPHPAPSLVGDRVGKRTQTVDDLLEGGIALRARTHRDVFITRGDQGILVVTASEAFDAPGVRVDGPLDIVGAGDSATAGIVLALAAGASPDVAAHMANLIASITIQQIGTTGVARPDQVLDRHDVFVRQQDAIR